MATNKITNDLFEEIFREDITVLLDWNALKKEGFKVEISLLTTKDDLAKLYTPWHLDEKNYETSCLNTQNKPLSLSQIKDCLVFFKNPRKQHIIDLANSFTKCKKRTIICVPLYKFAENGYFIMDGNHRLSALMLSDTSFKVLAFNVIAPANFSILKDLNNLLGSSPSK